MLAAFSRQEVAAVAIVAVFDGLTQEQYEEATRKLTGGKFPLETRADWPVQGILSHIAGPAASGFRVVDVWESEDAFARFGEHLLPILQEMGLQGSPEVYPAHTYVSD